MFTRRTALAFAVMALLCLPGAWTILSFDLGGWATAAVGVTIMFLATLFDREGFYGPRGHA